MTRKNTLGSRGPRGAATALEGSFRPAEAQCCGKIRDSRVLLLMPTMQQSIKRSFIVPVEQYRRTIAKNQTACSQLTPAQYTGIEFQNAEQPALKKQLTLN